MLDKANLLCIAAKSGKPKLKQLQWTQKNKPISTCLIKFQTNNDRTEIINLACPCSTVLLLTNFKLKLYYRWTRAFNHTP